MMMMMMTVMHWFLFVQVSLDYEFSCSDMCFVSKDRKFRVQALPGGIRDQGLGFTQDFKTSAGTAMMSLT